jgi:hypothetical protein
MKIRNKKQSRVRVKLSAIIVDANVQTTSQENTNPKLIFHAKNNSELDRLPELVKEKMTFVYECLQSLDHDENLNRLVQNNAHLRGLHWSRSANFKNIFRCDLWDSWRIICTECVYPFSKDQSKNAILIRVFKSCHKKDDTIYEKLLQGAETITNATWSSKPPRLILLPPPENEGVTVA